MVWRTIEANAIEVTKVTQTFGNKGKRMILFVYWRLSRTLWRQCIVQRKSTVQSLHSQSIISTQNIVSLFWFISVLLILVTLNNPEKNWIKFKVLTVKLSISNLFFLFTSQESRRVLHQHRKLSRFSTLRVVQYHWWNRNKTGLQKVRLQKEKHLVNSNGESLKTVTVFISKMRKMQQVAVRIFSQFL